MRNSPKSFPGAALTSLSLLAFGLISISARAELPAFTGDVQDVREVRNVEQHPGSSLLWEPSIAEWKPKYLVVAFGAGIPGKTDMGDIFASVSTDDGNKWGEPAYIFNHNERHGTLQFAYANPVIYKPPGEDVLWCFAIRCPMSYAHSEDSQLAGAFSGDGGRPGPPWKPAMHYTGPLITVSGGIYRIMENGQPRYLLPVHRNTRRNDPRGTRDLFLLSSTSLLEWRLAGYVPQPAAGPVFLQEGNLAIDGELKIVMRAGQYENEGKAVEPSTAFSSVSRDGGRTWTPAQAEPDLWNSNAKAFFGSAANGSHLYVYSDGPAWSRMALRYKVQSIGGGWGEEKTFYDSGTHNSYPTLLEIAPGEFRAVWDSGTKERPRTHICFGKFRLPAASK